jgi:2-polyprenyl-3-methyl-5-hydroxy-6-metoxy-1,4-benzoquinol methylase
MSTESRDHWEKVYNTKQADEVSWTQDVPAASLWFIHGFKLPKQASIIDVGGGDSKLVDFLLDEGYENITVLDIAAGALERAKQRLGEKAQKVKWIVADITDFKPTDCYDLWHDRAAFHFLTKPDQVSRYLFTARQAVKGYMTIGTFSENGPAKCSGLEIKRYNEAELETQLSIGFQKLKCIKEDHITPFNTTQNFLFCSFKRHHSN